jgi:cytidine deaminase
VLEEREARTLLTAAMDASRRAYAPYSGFPVGAALLTTGGHVFTGCNVENASFGLTVCAERVALWTAVAAGHRHVQAVAVVGPKAPRLTPCGACRQVLNEFVPPDHDIIIILDDDGAPQQMPLSALLPHAFGPRDLDHTDSVVSS